MDGYLHPQSRRIMERDRRQGDVLPFDDQSHLSLASDEADSRTRASDESRSFGSLPKPEVKDVDRKNWLGGVDWSSADPNEIIKKEHPLNPDNHNVGQQFIHIVEPMFDKLRDRPVTQGQHVQGYSVHTTDVTDGSGAHLFYGKRHVGSTHWDPETGRVHNLDVDEGHRHMTGKLLQEAWDYSRKNGKYGPAASNELTSYSEKLVNKYNPESEDFKTFKTDRDSIVERLRDYRPGPSVILMRGPENGA